MQPILPRYARRRIQRLAQKTRDANLRVRCLVVLRVAQGKSRHAVALELGCVPSTAWTIIRRFEEVGECSLFDRRVENGERKVDPDVEEALRGILRRSPEDFGFTRSTWTLELIVRTVEDELSLHLSVGHLWKVLRRMGVRWGCAKPVVACPWPAGRRRRRLKELRRLEENAPRNEVVLFADEVDIHLNPRIGRDWMLPGSRHLVVTPGQNKKRYLAGAFDRKRQQMVCVEGSRKTSMLFLNLLWLLLQVYSKVSRIHIILDNYVIHKSRIVKRWMRECGARIQLHFQPPYCPDANRIERVWLDLHNNVTRNHRCSNLQALMTKVWRFLTENFLCWIYRESCEGV